MNVVLIYFVLLALSYFAAASPAPTQATSTKASKYLTDKWEKWFFLEDFDHDDMLSDWDEDKKFEVMSDQFQIGSERKGAMYDIRELLWEKTFLFSFSRPSKEVFVDILKYRYELNKTAFIETFRMFDYIWLHLIDINMDGFLTKDEFLIDRTVSEHKDKLKDEEFFYSHKLVNGTIFIPDAVNVWLRFQTEEDPSKPDIMRDAVLSNLTNTTKQATMLDNK